MSVHVSSWAWRQRIGDGSAKLVLLKLADSASDEGECWSTQKYLAEECEMSERNLRFKLEKLEQAGLLSVQRTKKPDGTWNPNTYKLSSGSPLPMGGNGVVERKPLQTAIGNPEEIQRKPTSSNTPLEEKPYMRKPTSYGCPTCGLELKNERKLIDHRRNVHWEEIPLPEEEAV